jgi:hypothetical protein
MLSDRVEDASLGPAESVVVVLIRSDAGTVAEFAAENPRYGVNPRRIMCSDFGGVPAINTDEPHWSVAERCLH